VGNLSMERICTGMLILRLIYNHETCWDREWIRITKLKFVLLLLLIHLHQRGPKWPRTKVNAIRMRLITARSSRRSPCGPWRCICIDSIGSSKKKTLMEIADDRRARMSQSYAFISIRMIASVCCHGVPVIRKSCSMQSIAFCCGGQACPHTD